jgi:3'(2'), 5'-bisphosphate nucleotidase
VADLAITAIPVLSEEGKHMDFEERASWAKLWVVDPLDGTKEFVKRNGEFTVNVALIENGSPVLGVVYVPVSGELYYGCEGMVAAKMSAVMEEVDIVWEKAELMPLDVYKERDVFVAVGSRSHASAETQAYFDVLNEEHGRVQILSKGSSLKLCMVAEGAADVYPRFAPTMEWDTAAGHAVCKYAGCNVFQYDSKTPLTYNKENLLNPWFLVARERLEH